MNFGVVCLSIKWSKLARSFATSVVEAQRTVQSTKDLMRERHREKVRHSVRHNCFFGVINLKYYETQAKIMRTLVL